MAWGLLIVEEANEEADSRKGSFAESAISILEHDYRCSGSPHDRTILLEQGGSTDNYSLLRVLLDMLSLSALCHSIERGVSDDVQR
jgi:hypothetical protein